MKILVCGNLFAAAFVVGAAIIDHEGRKQATHALRTEKQQLQETKIQFAEDKPQSVVDELPYLYTHTCGGRRLPIKNGERIQRIARSNEERFKEW